jgi:ATP-binding cassette, subfamily B, bacterial
VSGASRLDRRRPRLDNALALSKIGSMQEVANEDSSARSWPWRWWRVLGFVRQHKASLLTIFLLTLVMGGTQALEPLVLKVVIDDLSQTPNLRSLFIGLAVLLVVGVLHEIVHAINNWLTWRTRIGVQYELLGATVERLHSLPLSFHQQAGVGATMTRLDRGVQGVVAGLSELAFNVLPALVYLAIALNIMLQLNWKATLVVAAFIPLPALIGALAAPVQTRRERRLLERWTKIYSRFNEVLGGILTVKSFAMEEAEKQRFLGGVSQANDLVVKGVRNDSWITALQRFVVVLARLAALMAGVYLVGRGEMSVGTIVAFLGYIAGMFGPVQGLIGVYQTLRRTSVALDTVLAILDAQDSLGDAPDAKELGTLRGDVQFSHVSFTYDGTRPILEDIDFAVGAGQMVALVGPSGSGKTTLMSLLQRIYDPTSGSVLIDGVDLRRVKQRSLRRQLGVVHQDALLFNDTVRHNVTYGRPDASDVEVATAARVAHAKEFIEQLPQGYETIIGERGSLLSAGQRQRLVIARALLVDPPILILDEATSALDAETEAQVQDALTRLMKGRTVFIIAHRLSTVTAADRVIVLSRGQVSETGTHDELLARQGSYASLVRRQLDGLRAGEPLL